jgi:chromosome segregation ATPase
MIKKLVITVLVVGLVGGVVMSSNLGSYVSTSYDRVANRVQDSVPVEFQIDRARTMIRDLEPEIRRSMHVIATEEVEVQELNKRIKGAEEKADKNKSDIMRLQSALNTGKNRFHFAGRSYSADQVKHDLTVRFTRYKTSDATLESLRKMRDARERHLNAARQQLSAMMTSQDQLKVEVENLEAKLKLVQVAEASSELQFDDSQLANVKKLMTEISTRLDVDAKLANVDENFHTEIPLDEAAPENIQDQVAEYFGLDAMNESQVATASYSE